MKRLCLIAVFLAVVALIAAPALVSGQTTTTATPSATTGGDTVITVPAEVKVPTEAACAGGVGIGLTLLIAAARIARYAGYDVPFLTPILDILARHRPGRMPGVGRPFDYKPPDAAKGPPTP